MGKFMSKRRRRYSSPEEIAKPFNTLPTVKSHSLDYGVLNKSLTEHDSGWTGLMQAFHSHSDEVRSIATFSPHTCISGSKDKTIIAQNLDTSEVIQTWDEHKQEVTKVRSKNKLIASGSRDRLIKLWNIDQKNSLGTFTGHSLVVSAVDFNKDGMLICSGSRDNSVKIWDTETEECISECSLSRNLVTDMRWMPGEHTIVQTSEDKILKLWDSRHMELAFSFPPQNQIQTCCDINGWHVITGCNGFNGEGCQIQLWDLRQRAKLQKYKGHTATVNGCQFSPLVSGVGFHSFMSCSNDGTVQLWQEHTSHSVSCLQLNVGSLTCLALLNKDTLVCGSSKSGINIVRIGENGRLVSAV